VNSKLDAEAVASRDGNAERVSPRAARAHALKNAISVARAASHLIAPELSARGRERAARLDRALSAMAALVDLDLAAEGRAAEERRREPFDMGALVREVCQLLCDRAEAANVVLVANAESAIVHGDRADLREALFNLVANAIEATPPEGAVFIDAWLTTRGEHVISVQDAGSGMEEDILRQLGAPRRTFRANGSGFGVAVAVDAVHAHGGLVRFDSTCGKGTRVTIWLPSPPEQQIARMDEENGVAGASNEPSPATVVRKIHPVP
jgi:signal transduction histidine kinase